MICERCGKEMLVGTPVCPACGAPTVFTRNAESPATSYGQFIPDDYGDRPSTPSTPVYEQGYRPSFEGQPYPPYSPPPPNPEYIPPYNPYNNPPNPPNPPPMYHASAVNVTVVNNIVTPSLNKNNALLIEILCSLFSIYGIGWLIAGETVTGIILLACSILIIWPLAIMIAVFTLGFGVFFCNLPLAVIGIILNAILLNNALNRKVVAMTYTAQAQPAQPAQQMPPRRMPQ